MQLDEKALRLPDFDEGIPITLGDGQTYSLPRPVVTFSLRFDDQGRPGFQRTDLGFGPGYMDLVERFHNSASLPEQLVTLADMTCRLLRRNYSLDNEALALLLPFKPGDKTNSDMWAELIPVCTGNASPKEDEPEEDL